MDVSLNSKPGPVRKGGPRLRKNRIVENKWGIQYEIAVQYAVLGRQCLPHMPTEPPASLSEEIVDSELLYVCKQCKDCFRFQSSFDDHNKRRSWIFGLWCHNCFKTVCTHITNRGTSCTICIRKDNEKRKYLREKGLSGSQKWGGTKVFYNQCQVFEHMKMHDLNSIDMSNLMLMPLPTNMCDTDWSPKIEIACEALMEQTFLLNMHIMDWLRINKVEDNWWKLADNNDENDDNVISKIVKSYKGHQLFKTFEKSVEDLTFSDNIYISNGSSNSGFSDISLKKKNNHSANMISDKDLAENEDNPCMSNDIAFVDCGPASKYFEPESLDSNIPHLRFLLPKKRTTIVKKSEIPNPNRGLGNVSKINKSLMLRDVSLLKTNKYRESTTTAKVNEKSLNENSTSKQSSKDAQQYIIAQPINKIPDNSVSKSVAQTNVGKISDKSDKVNSLLPVKKIQLHNTNSDHLDRSLQTSAVNCSSKVLAIQNPKDKDIASLINNLPPHLISNNKKLVFIGQDSCGFITFRNKNEVTSEKKLNKSDANDTDINTSSQKKRYDSIIVKKQQVAGKILIKNGKKYLIKHSENVTKNPENSSNSSSAADVLNAIKLITDNVSTQTRSGEVENIDIEQAALLHNGICVLTPSPSPSELSSSSSCESHVKQTLTTNFRKVPPQLISLSSTQRNMFETISLINEGNGTFMNIKLLDHFPKEVSSRDMFEIIPKYRQEMIDKFYQLDSFELKKRNDHLRHISEEMRRIMNFISDDVLKEKLRAISVLQHILEECTQKCNQNVRDKDDDVALNEWESELENVDAPCKCPACNKIMKPKSYIAGFSKLAKDDSVYCSCYKQVCHTCLSYYYGPLSRFIAHQNFHKKAKPHICPDCRTKFASAKFLEVHSWTACFHMLKKRIFACKICEIDGFGDLESVARHFATMHSIMKFGCEDCFKVFSSYSEYAKHYTETHSSISRQNPVRLVIGQLNDEVVRCENYMSYLEKYSAIRKQTWFKCPFCSLITLEDKHTKTILNAHLREKHMHRLSEVLSKEALVNIFGTEFVETNISGSLADTFVNANDAPCEDGTVVPRIVNTRTITSEIFERGSQDMGDTWPMTSDASTSVAVDVTTKKEANNSVTSDSLPKILDVRSIAGLNVTKPKTITESLTAPEKCNSQFKVIEAERERKNTSCKVARGTTTRSNSSKSDRTEEIKETKESKESKNNPNQKTPDSESAFKASTNSRIKVVDLRKICKPDIQPLVAPKSCEDTVGAQSENENARYVTSIPKPPPLARIPEHLFEPKKAAAPNNESRNVARSRTLAQKLAKKPKCRIDVSGPTNMQERYIEFSCHLCGERTDTSTAWKHFSEKHSREYRLAAITPLLTRMSSDFIEDKQFISNSRKRKSDIALVTSKRKRRWTPKKHTETNTSASDVGLCVEQETAEDSEGNFKCKKCDQQCTDMSDLREHIATTHRLKSRYLICLECGENFVVAPSLQMHLKAFHGIEDPITYMNQNPSYAPDINGLETEGRTTVANQCYVCTAVFEDKAAVDKHLRVHGMAFLNRKRIEARNALKNPEKKADMEENKQSPVKDSPKETARRDGPAETILEKLNAVI